MWADQRYKHRQSELRKTRDQPKTQTHEATTQDQTIIKRIAC